LIKCGFFLEAFWIFGAALPHHISSMLLCPRFLLNKNAQGEGVDFEGRQNEESKTD
jgi:hypothetical protein